MATSVTNTVECRGCETTFSPRRYDQVFCTETCCNKHHARLLKESGRCCACGGEKTTSKRFCDTCSRKYADSARLRNEERRQQVIAHYGDHCACCGEREFGFLCIDHVDGGGNEHRKSINHANMYAWLINNNFPSGFQTLCHNCNMAKGLYGTCPHERTN